MARPKSFLLPMEVSQALRAYNCQHNAQHRLNCGDKRLAVSNGRGDDHYCAACARSFIQRDIERLQALLAELSS